MSLDDTRSQARTGEGGDGRAARRREGETRHRSTTPTLLGLSASGDGFDPAKVKRERGLDEEPVHESRFEDDSGTAEPAAKKLKGLQTVAKKADEDEDVKPSPAALEAPVLLPPLGSSRRLLADRILAAFPDCHPAFVLRLMNEATPGREEEAVTAELETADYPLVVGGWKLGGSEPHFRPEEQPKGGFTKEVVCQCCFEAVRPSAAVQCHNGHSFCGGCAQTAVEKAPGGKAEGLSCFGVEDCSSEVLASDLQRVLPPGSRRKLKGGDGKADVAARSSGCRDSPSALHSQDDPDWQSTGKCPASDDVEKRRSGKLNVRRRLPSPSSPLQPPPLPETSAPAPSDDLLRSVYTSTERRLILPPADDPKQSWRHRPNAIGTRANDLDAPGYGF
ncbi:hypothetical protein JCM10213_003092 [Rhodosporidiobolus nylandii]